MALCALQATEALALVVPDDCATVTDSAGHEEEDDDCPDRCVRCLCSARRSSPVPSTISPVSSVASRLLQLPRTGGVAAGGVPRDVFHVPKTALH